MEEENTRKNKKRWKLIAVIAAVVLLCAGITAGVVYVVTSQQESQDSEKSSSKKKKNKKDKKKTSGKEKEDPDEDEDKDKKEEAEAVPVQLCRYSYGGGMLGDSTWVELRRLSDEEAELTVFSCEAIGEPEYTKTWTVSAEALDETAALIAKYKLGDIEDREYTNVILDGSSGSVFISFTDGNVVSFDSQQDLSDEEYQGMQELADLLYSFAVGEPETSMVDGVPEDVWEERGTSCEAMDFDEWDAEQMSAEELGEWTQYFEDWEQDLGFLDTYYYRPELIDWNNVLCNEDVLGRMFSYADLCGFVERKTGTEYREARCTLDSERFERQWNDYEIIGDGIQIHHPPVTFLEGYLSSDGKMCQLKYKYDDNYDDDQTPYDGVLVLRLKGGNWQYVSNWPVGLDVPGTLLSLDFYRDNEADEARTAEPVDEFSVPELPQDQPEMWFWTIARAREDGIVFRVERADHTAKDADRTLAEGGFPVGETVYESPVLNKGEAVLLRVNLSWQPDMRIVVEETQVYGGQKRRSGIYRLGEELYVWDQDSMEVPPSAWVTGETGAIALIAGTSDVEVTLDDFFGEWQDQVSGRCYMEITKAKGGAHVEIGWGDSAARTYVWRMDCTFDEAGSILTYKNGYAGTEGEEEKEIYKDGSGSLMMRNGFIFWHDDKEDQGHECQFVRILAQDGQM